MAFYGHSLGGLTPDMRHGCHSHCGTIFVARKRERNVLKLFEKFASWSISGRLRLSMHCVAELSHGAFWHCHCTCNEHSEAHHPQKISQLASLPPQNGVVTHPKIQMGRIPMVTA